MNKVKIALTLITIAIMVGPLLGVVIVYRDNLLGLVLPPDTPGMSSLTNSDLNMTTFQDMNPIQPMGGPTYDETTGAFDYAFNFTNPLPDDVSVDSLSADIYANDGTKLGTISLDNPINVSPGESAVVDIVGAMNPELIQQYQQQLEQGNVSVKNVDVTVGGITLHIDDLSQIVGGNNGGGNYQLPRQFDGIPTPGMVQGPG